MQDFSYKFRSQFINWLATNGMFNTIGLMSSINITISEEIPVAAVRYLRDSATIEVMFNPCVLNFKPDNLYFLMMHEIRHTYQLTDFNNCVDLFDWSPLGAIDKESKKIKDLAAKVFNYGADIALNQDVANLIANFGVGKTFDKSVTPKNITDNIKEAVIKAVGGEDDPNICGILLPEALEKLADDKGVEIVGGVRLGQSYQYYGNLYIKLMADDIKESMQNQENFEKMLENMLEGHDKHELEGMGEEEKEELANAARKAIEKAENESQKLALAAGRDASDSSEVLKGKHKVVAAVKEFIKKLRIRNSVANKEAWEVKKTFNRRNRKLPYDLIPGIRRIKSPNPAVVVVMDTSGSMWDETFFKMMGGTLQELHKRKKLARVYCCDTELVEIPIGNLNKIEFKGGGGTVFGAKHIDSILEDTGVSKVEIMYLTDEGVWGLRGAVNHPQAKVHVLNVPDILRGK